MGYKYKRLHGNNGRKFIGVFLDQELESLTIPEVQAFEERCLTDWFRGGDRPGFKTFKTGLLTLKDRNRLGYRASVQKREDNRGFYPIFTDS